MNLENTTLGQLNYLARFTEYREVALYELEVRMNGFKKNI